MPSDKLVAEHGTTVNAYQLEGGVWLPHAPILINEDFDFAIAMAMEGIGAGIAAAQRKSNNERKAKALEAVQLSPQAVEHIDRLRTQGTHAFFLLWGRETAVLKLVVEDKASCAAHEQPAITEGPSRPLDDSQGWLAPNVLSQDASALLK